VIKSGTAAKSVGETKTMMQKSRT